MLTSSDSCVNTVDADWDVIDGRGSFSTSVGGHGWLWLPTGTNESTSTNKTPINMFTHRSYSGINYKCKYWLIPLLITSSRFSNFLGTTICSKY